MINKVNLVSTHSAARTNKSQNISNVHLSRMNNIDTVSFSGKKEPKATPKSYNFLMIGNDSHAEKLAAEKNIPHIKVDQVVSGSLDNNQTIKNLKTSLEELKTAGKLDKGFVISNFPKSKTQAEAAEVILKEYSPTDSKTVLVDIKTSPRKELRGLIKAAKTETKNNAENGKLTKEAKKALNTTIKELKINVKKAYQGYEKAISPLRKLFKKQKGYMKLSAYSSDEKILTKLKSKIDIIQEPKFFKRLGMRITRNIKPLSWVKTAGTETGKFFSNNWQRFLKVFVKK